MKVCEICFQELSVAKDGENRCPKCDRKPQKKKNRNKRKEMDDLMASLGMERVRGAMGGVYYE